MRPAARLLAGVLAISSIAACDSGRVSSPQPAGFQASVRGSVSSTYQGEGFFRVVQLPSYLSLRPEFQPEPLESFILFSADPDRPAREVQTFALMRMGKGLPAVGTYALSDFALGDGSGFHAMYTHATQGQREQYSATSGEVRITHSSADRIEGSFDFRGPRICSGVAAEIVCIIRLPGTAPAPGAAMVEVSGSFSARPAPAPVQPPLGL